MNDSMGHVKEGEIICKIVEISRNVGQLFRIIPENSETEQIIDSSIHYLILLLSGNPYCVALRR